MVVGEILRRPEWQTCIYALDQNVRSRVGYAHLANQTYQQQPQNNPGSHACCRLQPREVADAVAESLWPDSRKLGLELTVIVYARQHGLSGGKIGVVCK